MIERKSIYLASAPHPNDLKVLEQLTENKHWDSGQFNQVMVALGVLGGGQAVPARNRPESIHLQNYRRVFEDLLKRSKETDKEHCRTIFVDKEKRSIVMSEKISIGTENRVIMHTTPQPGREKFQKLIGSVHTHPLGKGLDFSAHGLSGQDYRSFLSDPRQQFMIITYGGSVRMLVLKTSVTPNNIGVNFIERKISTIETDSFGSEKFSISQIVKFNKGVCLEFGLTFYKANKESNDLFDRINVVDAVD